MVTLQIVAACILAFFAINLFFIVKNHIRQDTFEAYSVANRSFGCVLFTFSYIGYWYVGSIYISWFNTSSSVGVFAQYILIYSMSSLVIMYFIAKPVWTWGKVYQLETQADFIQLRYGSKGFKSAFSVLTFIFWFPWLILEMKTIGYTISVATDYYIDFNLGMIIVCLYVIIYTFYGGMRGSAIANVVQGLFFAGVGAIFVGFLIWKTYGGVYNIFSAVEKTNPEMLVLQTEYGGYYWASVVITSTLGAFSLPGMFRLLYVAKNHRTIKKAACFAPLAVITNILLLLLLALGGSTLLGFPAGQETSLFWIAKTYGGNFILGMVAVFALAASMSTMSGVICTAAVMISKDWIGSIFKSVSRDQLLTYTKAATVAVGVISLYIASIEIPNLLTIALLMYDCIVQAFVPLFMGQCWKKSNLIGACIGMMTGILIAIGGNIAPETIVWANGWSAGMIGFMANLLIHIFCGLVFGKQGHVDELFQVLKANGSRQDDLL